MNTLSLKQRLSHYYAYQKIVDIVHRWQVRINPQREADRCYKMHFSHGINWETPVSLIDKTYWMLLHTDTSLWTKCADKYLVREYVKECGCESNLVPLYGKWDNAKEIEFEKLPNEFVIKTNHSCGTCIIVRNKNEVDVKKIKKVLNRWMSIPYGYSGMQLHYTKIKPCIMAEQLLYNDEEQQAISPNSMIDYKLWCINGEAESVLVVYDRRCGRYCLDLFDLQWNRKIDCLKPLDDYDIRNVPIPRPVCLSEMILIAEKLSKPFPEVRVDFYVIAGKPYIGELTFTTGYGYFTEDYYNYLGSKIDLSKLQKIK